jgi:thioredoxin reductase
VPERYKVAIVGSGPAGLSAAVRAAVTRVPHVVLEKTDHLSDTIFRYQLGKLIMATPVKLPMRDGHLNFGEGKREHILDVWQTQAGQSGINIQYHAEVKGIEGAKGVFTLNLGTCGSIRA